MWVFPHIVPVQGTNALHPAVDCGGDYHRVCAVLRDPEGVGLGEDEQQAGTDLCRAVRKTTKLPPFSPGEAARYRRLSIIMAVVTLDRSVMNAA